MTEFENIAIFKGKFGKDSYYMTDTDGIHTVYIGNYKPEEMLVSVKGNEYFILPKSKLLKRTNKSGKVYYKILIG